MLPVSPSSYPDPAGPVIKITEVPITGKKPGPTASRPHGRGRSVSLRSTMAAVAVACSLDPPPTSSCWG